MDMDNNDGLSLQVARKSSASPTCPSENLIFSSYLIAIYASDNYLLIYINRLNHAFIFVNSIFRPTKKWEMQN